MLFSKKIGPIIRPHDKAHQTPTFWSWSSFWNRAWGFSVDHALEFWLFMYPDKCNHASSLKNVWFKMFSPFSRIKFSNHRQKSTRFSESWGFSSWTTCTLYGKNLSWCTARWVDVRDILVSWDKRLKNFRGLLCSLLVTFCKTVSVTTFGRPV